MSGADMLGKDVEMFSGADPRSLLGMGRVVAYTDAPTYLIEQPDGTRTPWRVDLTREVEPAVKLPETPTLGWLDVTDTGQANFSKIPGRVLGIFRLRRNGNFDGGALGAWGREDITAFTPAVAVPVDALDELRDVWRHADNGFEDIDAGDVEKFLAAVDAEGAGR